MKNIILIFSIVIIGYYFLRPSKDARRVLFFNKTFESDSLSGDPCQDKIKCIAIYLAPWCPHCKASMPMIQKIEENSRRSNMFGLKLFIGNDSLEKTKSMSTDFNFPVFDDTDSKIKNLFPKGVPAWMVMDVKKRKVIKEKFGLPKDAHAFIQYALDL